MDAPCNDLGQLLAGLGGSPEKEQITGEVKMRILLATLMLATVIPYSLASGAQCPPDKPNHRMILKYTPETMLPKNPAQAGSFAWKISVKRLVIGKIVFPANSHKPRIYAYQTRNSKTLIANSSRITEVSSPPCAILINGQSRPQTR